MEIVSPFFYCKFNLHHLAASSSTIEANRCKKSGEIFQSKPKPHVHRRPAQSQPGPKTLQHVGPRLNETSVWRKHLSKLLHYHLPHFLLPWPAHTHIRREREWETERRDGYTSRWLVTNIFSNGNLPLHLENTTEEARWRLWGSGVLLKSFNRQLGLHQSKLVRVVTLALFRSKLKRRSASWSTGSHVGTIHWIERWQGLSCEKVTWSTSLSRWCTTFFPVKSLH